LPGILHLCGGAAPREQVAHLRCPQDRCSPTPFNEDTAAALVGSAVESGAAQQRNMDGSVEAKEHVPSPGEKDTQLQTAPEDDFSPPMLMVRLQMLTAADIVSNRAHGVS
jgi:hypothetical protein